jgi:hypothetical protein
MPYRTGGTIGRRVVPTSSAAGGIWQIGELEAARRDAIWPSLGDALFGSVSLLLHLDGNLTDTSGTPKTVTASGNAQTSTLQARFGSGSLLLDGSGDRLDSVSNAAYSLGTGDFTAEMFVRFASAPTAQVAFINVNTSGGFSLYLNGSAGAFFGVPVNTLVLSNRSANQLTASWTPATNVWYHLAVTRSSGALRAFVDGTQIGSTVTGNTTNFSQGAIQIGGSSDGATWTINGNLDEVRITKGSGSARYTTNFTPPTNPFPDST